jgi:hypothetical protein
MFPPRAAWRSDKNRIPAPDDRSPKRCKKICMDELMQEMASENLDIAETAALG